MITRKNYPTQPALEIILHDMDQRSCEVDPIANVVAEDCSTSLCRISDCRRFTATLIEITLQFNRSTILQRQWRRRHPARKSFNMTSGEEQSILLYSSTGDDQSRWNAIHLTLSHIFTREKWPRVKIRKCGHLHLKGHVCTTNEGDAEL